MYTNCFLFLFWHSEQFIYTPCSSGKDLPVIEPYFDNIILWTLLGEVTWQKIPFEVFWFLKDPWECQKMCQETTEVLGCETFTWDSVLLKCILSQDCYLLHTGYHISGPKECKTSETTYLSAIDFWYSPVHQIWNLRI